MKGITTTDEQTKISCLSFDSISLKSIDKTLDYFNFGPSFKKMDKTISERVGILYTTKWLYV